jgi:epoxyqueuosine reductase
MSQAKPPLQPGLRDNPAALKAWIQAEARALGFAKLGVTTPNIENQLPYLQQYLADGFAGEMHYLAENIDKRGDASLLLPGTQSVLCVQMHYLAASPPQRYVPDAPNHAIVSRYARGRDYHKVVRGRLKQLALRIEAQIGAFQWRPFADSAPILEKPLAERSGLGWTGKHTLLIDKTAGSFFFLGELLTDLDLPPDTPATAHCGSCSACIDICPTQAIVAPYRLDARRCIAYLTIELKGSIPVDLRRGIGNRVFGCDDCQLICPWNSFAKVSAEIDFQARHSLDDITLLDVWAWTEDAFLSFSEGSPLRRTGYISLKRNIAVGLGNAPYAIEIIHALQAQLGHHGEMVDEHIEWALAEQQQKSLHIALQQN